MGAYKQFLASDIIVEPFEVNKSFYFTGNTELEASNVSINRFIGTNITGTFYPAYDPTTGYDNSQYQRLVYNSIKELYYSNYLSSSYGDAVNTGSILPGSQPDGDILTGTPQSDGRYYNYPQSSLTFAKYFPTGSNATIGVISIPSRLYGNKISPKSFYLEADGDTIFDDGEGNIILSSSAEIVGNILYHQGLITITYDTTLGGYGSGLYGSATYGGSSILNNLIISNNVTCSFSSSLIIFETQYKATARANEFNFSQNPSLTSGSTQITSPQGTFYTPGQYINDFATGSDFAPYITSVGLYDDNYNLLAIGKLSSPLQTSPLIDTTILINLDR